MTRRAARRASALAAILCLAGIALSRHAYGAAFDMNDATWEGCAELLDLARRELGADRVIVLSTLDWERVQASDGVLVVHPTSSIDAEEAASFMKAGGRMAVLDDFGSGDALLVHFKIERRSLPTRPVGYLRGKPALAIATPAFDVAGGEVLGLHPTVAEVKQVVLNHGTGLRHPDLTPVLEVRAAGEPGVTVAVAGKIDGPETDGRLFAMGDPSAFINLMLRYPGNRAFATGLVRYLADGDSTDNRRGRLLIVANEFGEKGSFGGITPLRKTIDRKLRALLEALDELRERGFPWWLHLVVAGIAGLLLLWWAARALVRLYKSRLPRFARAVPLMAQGGVAGRIAVLSAPASPPALALLELRDALTEALAEAFHASSRAPMSQLLEQVRRTRGLSLDLERRIGDMQTAMRAAETAVLAGTGGRVTRADVERSAATVDEVLRVAEVEIPWPVLTRKPSIAREPA
jgi:hypothetical protein